MSLNVDKNTPKKAVTRSNEKPQTGTGNYTVKQGETLYSLMRKFNFKNESEIREYLKLSGTAQLQKGQNLTLPAQKLETTMTAIARKYNMSLKDLMELNPEIKDPSKVNKGQLVKVPIRPFEKAAPASQNTPPAKTTRTTLPVRAEKPKTKSAKEIAEEFKESASDYGAVSGNKFKTAFALLNTANIKDVLKEYNKISPDESLIKMICREVSNTKASRKEAVTKIYDLVAKSVGVEIATAQKRNEFINELEEQFDSWGLVSTKKLDSIINELLKTKTPSGQNTEQGNNFKNVKKNPAHKVQQGENLSSIAKKYNVRLSSLIAINGFNENNRLQPGKTIKIPDTISYKNIKSISDIAKAVGLSEEFVLSLKRSEDGYKMGDNEFHTTPYKDKNGNWTIGIGHLITKEEESKYLNKTLTVGEVCTLFAEDITNSIEDVKRLIGINEYNKMPQSMKDAVTDYMFSRGYPILKRQTEFVNALKSGNYAKAISLINVDYSYKRNSDGTLAKDKKGNLQRVYLTGMSKRRLFEMYMACKMYKGNIPSEVRNAIQNMYNRGLEHMKTEFTDAKEREAVHQSFNNEIRAWFGNTIQYK